MRIFKNKAFNKWAAKEGMDDESLRTAVDEMEQGLIDADLGGQVVKKRVALAGRGKSGGARTLIAYRVGDKVFFIYGFAKNARANISAKELKALKAYAAVLLSYSEKDLDKAVKEGVLFEVESDG
ncbi:MAG: type II toxin-antitoxin system RelE/ParE family toxin [Candidatus Thiodiazotropha sp.]